jgi:CHAD domain-containing protein
VGAVGIGLVVAKGERRRRAARKEAERERRFGLLAGEPPAQGLRRIALAQLELAIGLLRGEGESDGLAREEAVHEARKAFKRVRALMRMLAGELGEGTARTEQEVLREIAKSMAGARDAEVLVATLDGVLKRAPRKLGRRRAVLELQGRLERERREATKAMLRDTAARERAVSELVAMRARVARWRLTEGEAAIELAGKGVRDIYRAGDRARRKAKRARGSETRAQAMHRWRRHAKELRYALEALEAQDEASGKLRATAKRADALGEMLGEDHDLVVLSERVRAQESRGARKGSKRGRAKRGRERRARRARKQLLKQIERRRNKLRERALRQGARLYAAKPKEFVRGLSR